MNFSKKLAQTHFHVGFALPQLRILPFRGKKKSGAEATPMASTDTASKSCFGEKEMASDKESKSGNATRQVLEEQGCDVSNVLSFGNVAQHKAEPVLSLSTDFLDNRKVMREVRENLARRESDPLEEERYRQLAKMLREESADRAGFSPKV
ncbi:hypothetical protein [Pseudophaeobacter sp.]|uniref:hypothetical protein n=1 Tax=Pseudophaeobacter sp. TaxID=1971739 RepID=UPI00329A67E4